MSLDFFDINSRRAVMKIPVRALCVQAAVGWATWYAVQEGKQAPRADTLARLDAALNRFRLATKGDPGPLAVHSTYRTAMVLAATHLKTDARTALKADPAQKATSNAEWMKTAQVRRLAFWICHGLLGFKVTAIAKAAGVSKQAVSIGIQEIEDDDELNRIRDELEDIFRTRPEKAK